MLSRPFGRTGISLSEIGFGAWGIGKSMWVGAKDVDSLRALHRAMDLGVNFIDTARVYGMGHSEQLVGLAVREHDAYVNVATKVAPKNMRWPASTQTPSDGQQLTPELLEELREHAWPRNFYEPRRV